MITYQINVIYTNGIELKKIIYQLDGNFIVIYIISISEIHSKMKTQWKGKNMAKLKKKSSQTKPKSSSIKIEYVSTAPHSITPFLMFNANTEEVAKFYVSIFKKSKILIANSMRAEFILNGQKFFAYNGGPDFHFSWGVSFMISVETQKEVDYYWNALLEDGGKESMCGWIQDKYGMWWQVTPKILLQLLSDKNKEKAGRVMQAMLKMHKIDIASLKTAAG